MPNYECPTCKKTSAVDKKEDAPFRPFCTKRCKMIDLGRWLDGTYTITEEANSSQPSQNPNHTDDSTP